jgi:hypothetical protein
MEGLITNIKLKLEKEKKMDNYLDSTLSESNYSNSILFKVITQIVYLT